MAKLILEMRLETRFSCPLVGCKYGSHESLWTVQRRPVRQLGHYMTFRLNGEEIMYDPTLPRRVEKLPRDAQAVDRVTAARAWHSEGHYFFLPAPNEDIKLEGLDEQKG